MVCIDTNVFIYALDAAAGKKRQAANECIALLMDTEDIVLPMQVYREFLNVAANPQYRFSPDETMRYARLAICPFLQPVETPEFIERAFATQQRHCLSFYDALLLQAAVEFGCTALYSEDFQPGRTYDGVLIINPFAPAPRSS